MIGDINSLGVPLCSQSDPRFRSSKGRPRALGSRGCDNPFRALVREVAFSVDAGAILKELMRLGHVSLRDRKA
jgi:hypothetical protein